MPAARQNQPRICIVCPALAAANNGNWRTAARWRGFLDGVARVDVRTPSEFPLGADALIALHAGRSADAIDRFHARQAGAAIGVVLTGTDLYGDLDADLRARHSLECASAIVVLQERGLDRLDATSRAKARVIVQSAPALRLTRADADADFVAVGHLRAVKDPATLMRAARLFAGDGLPPARIEHIGAAFDENFADLARETMAACTAYRWLGQRSHTATRRSIARARALVHPSLAEGGANVVVEALRSGVPVLASHIDGNLGLLGADYAGTFAAGDAAALAALMRRFMDDAGFAALLRAQCARREPLFRPAAEQRAVRALAADLLRTAQAPS